MLQEVGRHILQGSACVYGHHHTWRGFEEWTHGFHLLSSESHRGKSQEGRMDVHLPYDRQNNGCSAQYLNSDLAHESFPNHSSHGSQEDFFWSGHQSLHKIQGVHEGLLLSDGWRVESFPGKS